MTRDYFGILLELAFDEDMGSSGDITSDAIFSGERTTAALVSKDTGILCGMEQFEKVFKYADPGLLVNALKQDGETLEPGMIVAEISGLTKSILKAERISINFLAFMSGIATKSHEFARTAFKAGNTVILDTRKTLPGYRELSKYAVRTGGAENHRLGLHDMVMIKDNHIDNAGSITEAVKRVRAKWGGQYRVEVECRDIEGVKEALASGVDIIMLDNMGIEECQKAIGLSHKSVLFEASGNMTIERIEGYSRIGIDYISVGALTHSVKAFDFSLKIPRKASETHPEKIGR